MSTGRSCINGNCEFKIDFIPILQRVFVHCAGLQTHLLHLPKDMFNFRSILYLYTDARPAQMDKVAPQR